MAGTVTLSERRIGHYWRMDFSWTTTAGGAADLESSRVPAGKVIGIVHIPGAGGVQPTDQYDVTLTDSDGVDVLNGHGANVSNAAVTQYVIADELGVVVSDTLTLNVTNGGNAKSGRTIIYLKVS
jgi:hypothetical protein